MTKNITTEAPTFTPEELKLLAKLAQNPAMLEVARDAEKLEEVTTQSVRDAQRHAISRKMIEIESPSERVEIADSILDLALELADLVHDNLELKVGYKSGEPTARSFSVRTEIGTFTVALRPGSN